MQSKAIGKGIGIGHGGNSSKLAVLRKIEPENMSTELQYFMETQMPTGTVTYRMGTLSVFCSPPHPVYQPDRWHLSIAGRDRYPTWDEVAAIRYQLLPKDRCYAMLLPPVEEYINIHNFGFQLVEVPIEIAQR